MDNKTLEQECGIDVDLIEVDGIRAKDLDTPTLTPEMILDKAGLSSVKQDFYNHNHCQYQRCIKRSY